MIYVTGDTHGDINRFKTKEIRALKKKDFLIICGDFGFIWDGSKEEEKILKWIGKRRFTTLFVEGTHDNIEKISQYPLEEVGGEKAHKISGRLFHLRRGCIYSFDEKRVFAFGGGESDDNDSRILGKTWWAEEIPNAEEVKFAIENLKLFDDRVDYIITHEAPPKIELSLDKKETRTSNLLANLLGYMSKNIQFDKWFFGCYHLDKVIPISYVATFREIVAANNKKK